MSLPICDKCGKQVNPTNDVMLLMIEMGIPRSDTVFDEGQSRHILPEGSCPGSPSTAQYLEGQPLDQRRGYPYRRSTEAPTREAYRKLLEKYS